MKILVTGASKGLGLSIANSLSKKHEVFGCARSLMKTDNFNYINGVDFENYETFSKLDYLLPEIDVLINNAAIADDCLLMLQGEETISKIINVNLTSTLILCKKYIRARFKSKENSNIINISSLCTKKSINGLAVYAASKAGLEMASKVLAKEVGPKGFRINCILPGYLETDMSKNLTEEYKSKILKKTPLNGKLSFDDINNMIYFLISENSKFVTGQSIVVDGGLTC